jgi:F-box protein 11
MSAGAPEALWARLCAALRDQRLLAPGNPTPAEVARYADTQLGGGDVSRFVNAYYYPSLYGGAAGALSEADAAALVAGFERRQPGPVEPPVERAGRAASLQALIDAAGPGQEIAVPRGVYRDPVRLDKAVVLVGVGVAGEVRLEVDARTALTVTAAATVRRIAIRSTGSPSAPLPALRIANGRPTIEDCVVSSGAGFDGVWLEAGTAAAFLRTRIEDNGRYAVRVARTASGTFDGCRIAGSADAGVCAAGNVRVRSCELAELGGDAVRVEESRAVFEHCRIHHNRGCGLYAGNKANLVLRQCRVHDNAGAGVLLTGRTHGVLETCEVWANQDSGIDASEGATATIHLCRVHGNGHDGLLFADGARGRLTECAIHENRSSGVDVRAGADMTVLRTTLTGNAEYGLVVRTGATSVMEGTSASGNGTRDVLIEDQRRP